MTHYARCRTCKSELYRRDYDSTWKHIHVSSNDHIAEPAKGSILNVKKFDKNEL